MLTRGCKFFAQRCSRFLSGQEALIAQGWALHRSMRGFVGSLADVFAHQSDRCVTGFAGNGMHCASVGLVLHWILIRGSLLNNGVGNLASMPSPLGAPSVKLSRKELRDVAVSGDRLLELRAAGKLSQQQLLYLKFPVDAVVPNETCAAGPPEQISRDSTAVDNDVRDVWVSELLQSVANVSVFASKHGELSGGPDNNDDGSLPACGRKRDLFPLPPLFELVLNDISWTPRPAELAYARASVIGMNYLYAVAQECCDHTFGNSAVCARHLADQGSAHVRSPC